MKEALQHHFFTPVSLSAELSLSPTELPPSPFLSRLCCDLVNLPPAPNWIYVLLFLFHCSFVLFPPE